MSTVSRAIMKKVTDTQARVISLEARIEQLELHFGLKGETSCNVPPTSAKS